jgi:hypothetical protein
VPVELEIAAGDVLLADQRHDAPRVRIAPPPIAGLFCRLGAERFPTGARMVDVDPKQIAKQFDRLKDDTMTLLAEQEHRPATKADLDALEWRLQTCILATVVGGALLTIASIFLILLLRAG